MIPSKKIADFAREARGALLAKCVRHPITNLSLDNRRPGPFPYHMKRVSVLKRNLDDAVALIGEHTYPPNKDKIYEK